MTQVTPPGWYPDPGQTSDGPPSERWWDGKAWTERTRPAGAEPSPAAGAASTAAGGAGASAAGADASASADAGASARAESAGGGGSAPVDAGPDPSAPTQTAFPAYPGSPPQGGLPGYGPPPGYAAQPGYGPQPAYGAQPYPVHPGYPGVPSVSGSRNSVRVGVAVAAAVAVLASIGVGVWALSKDDGGGGRDETRRGQPVPGQDGGPGGFGGRSGGPGDGASPSPRESEAPRKESGSVTDRLSGISLPIPKGWYGQEGAGGATVTSEHSYACPGDTSKTCTKGGAYSAPAFLLGTRGTTAEAVAKADIADNAEESYGGSTYGSITTQQLAAKPVTVAGQKGYMVRWKAVTSKGADGVVESLAFPSPADPRQIVVVRFGVDADQDLSVIDRITQGIEAASTGGGNGQEV
ncbi:DUF2510 domain-containing protein [Streptomyces sp. XM83C]|uniref:DUF2510 domain-containing protein n=1 Tax=Streptomyces sp. XM83C TaxID=2929781 RepID=UPI001FF730EB|nr:DUF2510 domain-containing protein [Streptomyces sp. XM83C]MCK1821040.1 DUF2510 domain-containing protein [Streptomyces sp. XM83C]